MYISNRKKCMKSNDIDNFGYVTVNKKELKLLCEDCIEHIKKCREKRESMNLYQIFR